MRLAAWIAASALAATALTGFGGQATAQERVVKVAGFGANSGVVRVFGVNAWAAMRAAADQINEQGGVTLADGSTANIEVNFYDDRCNAEEGISVVRRIASDDYLTAIGPTCSNVAEPLYGILQARIDDDSDTGLQFPLFTDVAIKGGLAQISDWAFRNVPSEAQMYDNLFAWLKEQHPDLETIYGGVEEDFAHSRATWYAVMKEKAPEHGLEVLGEVQWLLNDTNFSTQGRELRRAEADIVAIAAHPFTTCGILREMSRQGIEPKILVGLTSSSSLETLTGCAEQAEGIIIPTSFAPVNADAAAAADLVAEYDGSLDLHSASMWENMMILRDVINEAGITGTPEALQEDRRKIRDGLAALTETDGLLGMSQRTPEGEAIKPYVFVQAKDGAWEVLHEPAM
ncbi:MAG TPA: ABC transporter substrate-binding protein [Aestuariivirgaceae bacterium]|nr:ABC transporter substrate-binding protein [Aestuariivirgaceae bacterium]